MSVKKIFLIALIITTLTTFIPIQRSLRDSFECGHKEEAECFSEYTTYGFPFLAIEPSVWNSPVGAVVWENGLMLPLYIFASAPNFIFYTLILLVILGPYIQQPKEESTKSKTND